jgi:hypothetical protein
MGFWVFAVDADGIRHFCLLLKLPNVLKRRHVKRLTAILTSIAIKTIFGHADTFPFIVLTVGKVFVGHFFFLP